jgi:hypothetical protein
MEPGRLEKFIKKQVEQHKTATDPDMLWQKIQAKKNGKKKSKRRFLFFWLLGGALLLGAFIFAYGFWNTDQPYSDRQQAGEGTSLTNTSGDRASQQSDQATMLGLQKQQATAETPGQSSVSKAENEKANTSTNQTAPDGLIDAMNEAAQNQLTKPAKISPATSISSSATTDELTASQVIDESIPASVRIGNNPPAKVQAIEKNASVFVMPEETSDKEKGAVVTVGEQNNEQSDYLQIKYEYQLLPRLNLEIEYKEPAIGYVSIPQENLLSEKSNTIKKQWRFSNGAAFTYGIAQRTFLEKAIAPEGYIQTRSELETPLDAVRISLDMMTQHKSGFYLKTGLEYEQINERFDVYIEWDSTKVHPNQVLALTFAMDGTSTETIGSQDVSTTYWTQQRIYNHYYSIDIPLLVGFSPIRADQKLGWFVEGGASVNVWFNANGRTIDTASRLLIFSEQPDLFKTRTGVSLLAAAGLTYQIADQFSIWANPAIRYRLRSITSNENPVDQRYLNLGFNVGLRYHWRSN